MKKSGGANGGESALQAKEQGADAAVYNRVVEKAETRSE